MKGAPLSPQHSAPEITARDEPVPDDVPTVRAIVESTGFFHPPEVDVAVELVTERLNKGAASGYHFVFAMQGGQTVGYACYGEIACTQASYDLYWIAVDRSQQQRGLGRWLLREAERRIAALGGRRVYIETSGRPQYAATRAFYERCDYTLEATLADFYAPGDAKCIYVRALV